MDEPYVGTITVTVSIPAELVEDEMNLDMLNNLEWMVAQDAEGELHSLIAAFRQARRG